MSSFASPDDLVPPATRAAHWAAPTALSVALNGREVGLVQDSGSQLDILDLQTVAAIEAPTLPLSQPTIVQLGLGIQDKIESWTYANVHTGDDSATR